MHTVHNEIIFPFHPPNEAGRVREQDKVTDFFEVTVRLLRHSQDR